MTSRERVDIILKESMSMSGKVVSRIMTTLHSQTDYVTVAGTIVQCLSCCDASRHHKQCNQKCNSTCHNPEITILHNLRCQFWLKKLNKQLISSQFEYTSTECPGKSRESPFHPLCNERTDFRHHILLIFRQVVSWFLNFIIKHNNCMYVGLMSLSTDHWNCTHCR